MANEISHSYVLASEVPGAKTGVRMWRVISGPEMTRGKLIGIE